MIDLIDSKIDSPLTKSNELIMIARASSSTISSHPSIHHKNQLKKGHVCRRGIVSRERGVMEGLSTVTQRLYLDMY